MECKLRAAVVMGEREAVSVELARLDTVGTPALAEARGAREEIRSAGVANSDTRLTLQAVVAGANHAKLNRSDQSVPMCTRTLDDDG